MSTSYVYDISSAIRNHDDFVNNICEKTKTEISSFINNNIISNVIHAKYDGNSLELKSLPFNLTLTTSDTYKATISKNIITPFKVIEFNILERDNSNFFNLYIEMDGGISFPNPGDNLVGYHDEKDLLYRNIIDSLFEQLLKKEFITPNIS